MKQNLVKTSRFDPPYQIKKLKTFAHLKAVSEHMPIYILGPERIH